MAVAVKEKTTVFVKTYFDPMVSNMGLEKYGLSVWDGTHQVEDIGSIEQNGQIRYITGLNEFAPEVKLLPDEMRKARILDIRQTVARLEKELATNVIPQKYIKDVEDESFWTYVKLLRPDNKEFWGKISIKLSNDPLALDPEVANDLILIYAIEAGGFSLVARSYEDARTRSVPPKFYLDKYRETASTVTSLKKLRNKAGALLQDLFDTNTVKLMYVAKVVDGNSVQYKKTTPNDVVYENMDKYISGLGIETSIKRATQSFIDTCDLDMETLKLRSIIKDATFYKYIATKSDGFIYHLQTGALLGRTPSDVLEFMRNPLNDQVMSQIMKQTETHWN